MQEVHQRPERAQQILYPFAPHPWAAESFISDHTAWWRVRAARSRGRGQTPTEQALLTPVVTGHWAATPGARVGLEVSKAAHGARSG